LDTCAIRAGGSCGMAHSEARCWSWRIEFVSAIDEFSNRPRSEWRRTQKRAEGPRGVKATPSSKWPTGLHSRFGSQGRAVSFRMFMGAPALSLEIRSAKRNRRRRGRSRRGCIGGDIFRGNTSNTNNALGRLVPGTAFLPATPNRPLCVVAATLLEYLRRRGQWLDQTTSVSD
jgi:hypothetical protein